MIGPSFMLTCCFLLLKLIGIIDGLFFGEGVNVMKAVAGAVTIGGTSLNGCEAI